ncbi:NADH(P)-binding-domain-containing protein, partial [Phialemonium atrogriseum]
MATATPLKVAVLGPAGQCGSCVVDELLSRGHTVVGISRNPPEDWKSNSGYSSVPVDIQDTKKLSKVFSAGFDAIVSAYAPPLADLSKVYETGVEGHGKIKMALLESSHEGQIIVIGGAGSLHTKNGQQLV